MQLIHGSVKLEYSPQVRSSLIGTSQWSAYARAPLQMPMKHLLQFTAKQQLSVLKSHKEQQSHWKEIKTWKNDRGISKKLFSLLPVATE